MKLILRVFFFFIISAKLFAQAPASANKLIYLDSLWTPGTPENYKYTRLIEDYYSEKKSYVYKDHYKSGAIKYIANTTNKDVIINEGQAVSYYENGNKKSSVSYVNSKKTGKEFNWYENGNLKSELEYSDYKKGEVDFKVNNYWTPNKEQTVTAGNGKVEDTSYDIEQSGTIKDGFPDGIWKGKNLKSKYIFTEQYENGKLISGKSIDSLNIEHRYKIISEKPLPKNGIDSFYRYFSSKMVIPVDIRNKVSGKIYMTFIVDETGNLVDPKVIKGVGYGLDENAIQIIKEAKKWNPGLIRGIPARILYKLPITIVKNGQ